MKRIGRSSWWGLYLLLPLAVIMLFGSAAVHATKSMHMALACGSIITVSLLALRWSERHPRLMQSQGVDRLAEEDALAAEGIEPGTYEPSLMVRQAEYRAVMFRRHDAKGKDS